LILFRETTELTASSMIGLMARAPSFGRQLIAPGWPLPALA
jgi:hypothetical protein